MAIFSPAAERPRSKFDANHSKTRCAAGDLDPLYWAVSDSRLCLQEFKIQIFGHSSFSSEISCNEISSNVLSLIIGNFLCLQEFEIKIFWI